MDAIIIADSGSDSFSGTSPLKLTLEGRVADIQTVANYVAHNGRLQLPVAGAEKSKWAAAPKLNGIYLQSYLSRYDFRVALINSYYDQRDSFMALLRQTPRAIMISTTFIVDKVTLVKLAADIRSLAPGIPIIAGGPFIYFSYGILQRIRENEYLLEENRKGHLFLEVNEEPDIDLMIVSTRGEAIAREALLRIRLGDDFKHLPNTVLLKNGVYHFSERVDDREDPQPPIDWLRLEPELFASGVIPLQASNGCPNSCAFCNFVKDPKMVRVKPMTELMEEIRHVHRCGVRYIWFVDDNFRLGKRDLVEFCHLMVAANLDISWITLIRAESLDPIDPLLLRRAGCIEVQMGLESADPGVLQLMNKKASPQLYGSVLKKVLAAGINCACYLIFGFPGETEASVQRTIAFMKQFDDIGGGGTISWSLFPFVLAPLSPVYEPAMREKLRLKGHLRHWRHATMDSSQAMHHVLEAFMAIETSGSIYRTDNQDYLHQMTPEQCNTFHHIRHKLAKKATEGVLAPEEIVRSFETVIGDLLDSQVNSDGRVSPG